MNDINYVAYETLESIDSNTTKIAKIKIGYGDGFPKCNKGSYCLINKKEYKISQVTMDNTFIEVDDKVKAGDIVQLYHKPNELKAKTGCGALELYIALFPLRIKRILKGEKMSYVAYGGVGKWCICQSIAVQFYTQVWDTDRW